MENDNAYQRLFQLTLLADFPAPQTCPECFCAPFAHKFSPTRNTKTLLLKSNNVALHICPDFQRFCPNFQQIKTFGGALVPLLVINHCFLK